MFDKSPSIVNLVKTTKALPRVKGWTWILVAA